MDYSMVIGAFIGGAAVYAFGQFLYGRVKAGKKPGNVPTNSGSGRDVEVK